MYINKGSIQQEDITIINIYTLNQRPSKYMKYELTELKGSIVYNDRDFDIQLTIVNRTTRQDQKTEDLNRIKQHDLTYTHIQNTLPNNNNKIHILLKST